MYANVIDISHHNAVWNFDSIRNAGIIGVIHKAVQGAGYHDPEYIGRRKAAVQAGLLWGAYAFNTGENIKKQVDNFFRYANPDDQTMMALDFEDNPGSQMSLAQAKDFLAEVDRRLGRACWLYSGNRVKDLLGSHKDEFLGRHPLWLAQYGPKAIVQPSWERYSLWQFSESGHLPGTDGKIDFNYADPAQLREDWTTQLFEGEVA